MKRYLYIIALLALLSPIFTACEDGLAPSEELIGDIYEDIYPDEEDKVYNSLNDFSYSGYPEDTDRWIINDRYAMVEDFYGLRDAYSSACNEGRDITLVFPNLKTVPTTGEEGAFYWWDKLTAIELPAATEIERYGFFACQSLTSIYMPNISVIGDYAFSECNSLNSIDIASVEEIGYSAFKNCYSLTSIKLPQVETIRGETFNLCTSLLYVDAPRAVIVEGENAFGRCDALSYIELPMAAIIGTYTFSDCSHLSSIDLPYATSIEQCAFTNCYSLKSLSLATARNVRLDSIDSYALYDTDPSYITLTLGEANSEFVKGNTLTIGAFSEEFQEIILVDEYGNVVEPEPEKPSYAVYLSELSASNYPIYSDTWTIWDSSATTTDFVGLSAAIADLNNSGRQISLEFPNLQAIPDYAIFGEYGSDWDYPSAALVSVSADVATSVGGEAFYHCTALTSVEFPAATEIGNHTFSSCDALTSVEFPAATLIGGSAFWGCQAITKIELPKAKVIDATAFGCCYDLTTVEIPMATEIGLRAFIGCIALTSLDIPSTVTSIGGGAFNGCDNLTYLNIYTPNFIYEDGIVYNSDKTTIISALNAVVSGDYYSPYVTSVEDNAFNTCPALTSIELPAATEIGSSAFGDCNALTTVILPKVTRVKNATFYVCRALTTVELPLASEIEMQAFGYCDALTTLSIATAEYAFINSIHSDAFFETDTANTTLILGKDNRAFVSGNTWTMGEFNKTFKHIILRNIGDALGGDGGDAPDLGYEELF